MFALVNLLLLMCGKPRKIPDLSAPLYAKILKLQFYGGLLFENQLKMSAFIAFGVG